MTGQEQTQKKRVIAAIVLDASGSMDRVKSATISGVNEWIEDQRRSTETLMDAVLVQFNSQVRSNLAIVPVASLPLLSPITYAPQGNTALLDAVGTAIRQLDSYDADAYLVYIVTDGEENASREFTQAQIRTMVTEREARGTWSFVFLGANIDAWLSASALGMQRGNVAQYSPNAGSVAMSFEAVSRSTSRARDGLMTNSSVRDVLSTADYAAEVQEANLDLNPNTQGRSTTD
jgi:uncharacterized protein YegL